MKKEEQNITRKDAVKKIGQYGKYAALTALGTYIVLSPLKAQAKSCTDAHSNCGNNGKTLDTNSGGTSGGSDKSTTF